MKILMLCSSYSLQSGHSWLTDSLAEELALNHSVEVVFLDWSGQHKHYSFVEKNGVKIHVLSAMVGNLNGRVGQVLKWFLAARLNISNVKKYLSQSQYDLVINYSPAMVMHPIFKALKRRVKSSYLILWDFFPIYHLQLGLLPNWGAPLLKFIETKACSGYDRIGLMSPKNLEFFKRNYKVRSGVQSEVLYLWGPNDIQVRNKQVYLEVRASEGIQGQLVCVFGGQLIKGRGIDKLIELAIHSKKNGIDSVFYIFGDGPERDAILNDIKANDVLDIVRYKGFRPREEYMRFLKGADLGFVFNSGHVSVPTFPSKAVDFFRAAVPVLAYVEDATDFGSILEEEIRGGWSASPKSHSKLVESFEAAYKLSTDELFQVGCSGQKWYLENLQVRKASHHLTDDLI
ncbi:glycosyltransferase family 4 protein [Pseudomonas sp. Leaf48]|uniref:glycosyltransferase family 4 protein n=1 Tax=Pseudomonas sp. Leaf48 TaxID=1736221 RepID=UPI0012E8676D|nr:glycosyltransferase family 4 protein [Pseudomonas sp. Leaf48]